MKRMITYDTYGLFHYGHIVLPKCAQTLEDSLMVVLSGDRFNAGKGKQPYFSYEERRVVLEVIRYVDLVVPELTWGQKIGDIVKYSADVPIMKGDWNGEFGDQLEGLCEVVHLPRTPGVSTTRIKSDMRLG